MATTDVIDLTTGLDSYFPETTTESDITPHIYEVVSSARGPSASEAHGSSTAAFHDQITIVTPIAGDNEPVSSENIDTSSAGFESLLRQYTEGTPYRPVNRQLEASKKLYQTLESPLQQLSWLQQEIAALQTALPPADSNNVELAAQAKELQAQLGELVHAQLLQSRQRIDIEASALQSTSSAVSTSTEQQKPPASTDRKGQRGAESLAYLARLEERLNRLETRLIGSNSPSSLPVVERLRFLEAQISSLTPEAVELLDARAKLVLEEHQRNSADFQILPSKIAEIEDVHRLMTEWDAVRKDLPRVVERLNTLKNVHDSSVSFAQDLQSAQTAAASSLAILKSNDELLHQVQAGFESNIRTILENCETLKKRIDALQPAAASS